MANEDAPKAPLTAGVHDDVEHLVDFLFAAFNHSIPEVRAIPESEFRTVALLGLEEANALEIRPPDMRYRVRRGVGVGPNISKGVLKVVAELIRARVAAIRSGDPAVFLVTKRPLRVLSKEGPLLEPGLEAWLRHVQPEMARADPKIASVPFEAFANQMVALLSMSGDVQQLVKGGRAIWCMTKRMKRRLNGNR
jgi:hypothetical protein